MATTIAGIAIPDSKMAQAARHLARENLGDLLFHHSARTFVFGALAGVRKNLVYDAELLYVGALFHALGLAPQYNSRHSRFEVDGANAARNFLSGYGTPDADIEQVWDAIALHTTPGIAPFKKPVVALVTAGVDMDLQGLAYHEYTLEQRSDIVHAYPREDNFNAAMLAGLAGAIRHKPGTAFGNSGADLLARHDPSYQRGDFCARVLGSPWLDQPSALSAGTAV